MQAIGKHKEKSLLFFFVIVSYAQIWLLYGIGRLLNIPFSMDPRQLGGLFYLFGAAAPLFASIVATVIITGKEGLNHLFRRSFGLRFSPIWYLTAIFIPFAVTAASTWAAISVINAAIPKNWFLPSFGIGFLLFFLI